MSRIIDPALRQESNSTEEVKDPDQLRMESEEISTEIAELNHIISLESLTLEELSEAYELTEEIRQEYEQSLESEDGLSDERLEEMRRSLESAIGEDIEELTQEGLNDVLKRLGQAVKNVGGRLERATRDFLSQIFEGHVKLRKRAEVVRNQIEQLNDNAEPHSSQIHAKGGSKLYIDNTIQPSKLSRGLPEAAEKLENFNNTYLEFAEQFFDHMESIQNEIMNLDEDAKKEDVKRVEKRAKRESSSMVSDFRKALRGLDKTTLPGGHMIRIMYNDAFYVEERVDRNRSRKRQVMLPMIYSTKSLGKYEEKEQIATPTPDQIGSILDAAVEVSENVTYKKDAFEEIFSKASDLTDAAKHVSQIQRKPNSAAIGGDDAAEVITSIVAELVSTLVYNYFGNNAKRWARSLNEGVATTLSYEYSFCRAAVSYCERAAKEYA